jgi:phospholipid transport system substrate-binding protein
MPRHLVPGLVMVTLVLALAVAGPGLARAGDPAIQLTAHVSEVFKTLDDPALKTGGNEVERRLAVRRIVDDVFDFGEAARRTLGRHWEQRTESERERFVKLFTDLIDRAYLRRIDHLDGEQLVLVGSAVDGDDATVQTRVITRDNSQMPVDFLMTRAADDQWRVWDVRVGGMSLIGSYRAQFNKIIVGESFEELVRRLEAKTAAQP